MSDFDIDQIDLDEMAAYLQQVFRGHPPEGAIVGRTNFRDALVEWLGCSELDGEIIVDTMVARGLLTLDRDGEGREIWRIKSSDS